MSGIRMNVPKGKAKSVVSSNNSFLLAVFPVDRNFNFASSYLRSELILTVPISLDQPWEAPNVSLN